MLVEPIDVVLLNVSPPDEHGFCSYGVDVGTIKSAAEKAKIIISQLFGKTLKERARELIRIAHPKFRDESTRYAKETFHI